MTARQKKPSPEIVRLLVRVVAMVDVCFMPNRYRGNNAAAVAIEERRAAYREQAGVVLIGGGSDQTRQAHSRTVEEARVLGLITARGGSTRPIVGLTEAGTLLARGVASTGLACHAWPTLKRLASLQDATACEIVPEWGLAGQGAKSSDLLDLEFEMLPLLVEGLVESESDTLGLIGYSITPAGWSALRRPAPTEPAGLARGQRSMGNLYVDLLVGGLRQRDQWEPSNTHQVYISLSAGAWPPMPWDPPDDDDEPADQDEPTDATPELGGDG